MVIRIPFPPQRFATQSTSFRAPVASVPPPPWRVEIDRIGVAFRSLHRAAERLQAQHPQSALSLELGDLEKKLEKAQRKISAGPLGGLVGDGPLARCFATRREHAQNVTRILATLAEAATLVAADLEALAQDGTDTLDGAALTSLREKQRDVFRRLDEVKGCMPKEQTRFKLRTLAIVATTVVSVTTAIISAMLAPPILVIPLTVAAVGLAINATLHFMQRRDTGWKALTQLIDQFAASSRDLNYDALHDVVTCLSDGIRTLRIEHQASRDEVSQRLADLAEADRERSRMMIENTQHTARNEAQLRLLHDNVDDLKRTMTTIRQEIDGSDGSDGLAATIDHLGRLVASLREPQQEADSVAASPGPVRPVDPGVAPSVAAALRQRTV